MKPYQMSVDAVINAYRTNDRAGLSQQEAQTRLNTHGPNELRAEKRHSWLAIFFTQFQNPLVYILLAAAIIIFFVGDDARDAFIISAVLIFNAIIGTIQEGRTADIIESLKQLIETKSIVIRDNKKEIIDDRFLVVGDLVVLQEGERVPADIRIIETNQLMIDQAVLTGESTPVRKDVAPILDDVPVIDRINMAYKGTYILSGTGKGIVIATGPHTEIGRVHHVMEEIQTDIPLKKDVEHLAYIILLAALAICALLFIIGYVLGKPLPELLVMLTALFICVVPEGLPVVLTLVLVSGVYRMAKQHVLVKNMQAVETLGRTDVIVIDKTGTLTRNEMMVSYVYADNQLYTISGQGYYTEGSIAVSSGHIITTQELGSDMQAIAHACYLLNTTEIHYQDTLDIFSIKGDPTEAALYVFAQKLGLSNKTTNQYTKIYEIPFGSDHAYHAGFFEHNEKVYTYVLGAPEVLFAFAQKERTDEMQNTMHSLLDQGLRTVACAMKIIPLTNLPDKNADKKAWIDLIGGIRILGILAIEDAVRTDVRIAIAQARKAGLSLVMATGDHMKTALYVAKKVDIFVSGDKVLDGDTMAQLSDEELINESRDVTVYCRVSPLEKLRIIDILHKRQLIVAMTGDGINDAPSLMAADLGIAMGRIGTEVAKRASGIILLDDSFINIIRAIQQGRHIFYTLKKVILYFFATNVGEIFIILFALITELITRTSMPLPLTAAQILWLNLVTDGFLNVALSMEPEEQGLLNREWLIKKTTLIDKALIARVLFFAIPMGIVSLYMFLAYYTVSIPYARTMTFVTMTMFQWFNAWNCRSNTKSLFQIGLTSNKWLMLATAFIVALQICITYVPFLQDFFDTVSLRLEDWILIFACSLPIIIFEETRKVIVRKVYKII